MEYLDESLKSFINLCNYKYYFLVGNSKFKFKIILDFDKSEYFHLIGLGKIKDIPQLNESRKKVFQMLLDENSTLREQLNQNDKFNSPELIERRKYLCHLKDLLEGKESVFRINRKLVDSNIICDFIITGKVKNVEMYFFIRSSANNRRRGAKPVDIAEYGSVSFFLKKEQDYSIGQIKQSTLLKMKENKTTEEVIILHESDGLNPSHYEFNIKK